MPRATSYSYSRTIHWQEWAGKGFLAVLFIAALVLVAFSRVEDSRTTQARQQAAGWLSSAGHFISSPVDSTAQAITNVQHYFSHITQAQQLAEENAVLLQWKARAEQLQAENESLRRLLNVAPTGKQAMLTAKILGNTSGPYSHQLHIAGGTEQNIQPEMAAMTDEGLVGRVLSVQNGFSQVMSVTDINSRVAVMTGKSREHAVVKGLGETKMGLFYLPEKSKLQLGEKLYTSGDGGLMPANILVGTVSKIENDAIQVIPAVDPARLEYVRLVATSASANQP